MILDVPAAETMGEEIGPDRTLGSKGEEAPPDVARRWHTEAAGESSGGAAIVGHGHDGGDLGGVVLDSLEGASETVPAAEGNDPRSANPGSIVSSWGLVATTVMCRRPGVAFPSPLPAPRARPGFPPPGPPSGGVHRCNRCRSPDSSSPPPRNEGSGKPTGPSLSLERVRFGKGHDVIAHRGVDRHQVLRVGSLRGPSRTRGCVSSHLLRTTFCWLPPDNVATDPRSRSGTDPEAFAVAFGRRFLGPSAD